jgi:hypothetical protein
VAINCLFYVADPNWQPGGEQTQEKYSNRCKNDIDGVSHRLIVTETGASLDKNNKDYQQYDSNPNDGDVNSLRGLDDCLTAMKKKGQGVIGVYPWHGWDNGDSYSFFGKKNSNGRAKMQIIEKNA